MRNLATTLLVASLTAATALSQTSTDSLVLVEGGPFQHGDSNFFGNDQFLSDFYIGKYEVTQKEWIEVMGDNPSQFKGDNYPVEMVSWYQCIEYCNKRSELEGLTPYYNIEKNAADPNNQNNFDDIKWTVTINAGANGYRLPTEAEWEYAASGGQKSEGYTYSGSNDIDEVGWYWQNSGDEFLAGLWNWPSIQNNNSRTKAVGSKEPNELGIYDMSGNVREWCWDWFADLQTENGIPKENNQGVVRIWKGGGWVGGDFCCASSYRAGLEANGLGYDQGFRICRSKSD